MFNNNQPSNNNSDPNNAVKNLLNNDESTIQEVPSISAVKSLMRLMDRYKNRTLVSEMSKLQNNSEQNENKAKNLNKSEYAKVFTVENLSSDKDKIDQNRIDAVLEKINNRTTFIISQLEYANIIEKNGNGKKQGTCLAMVLALMLEATLDDKVFDNKYPKNERLRNLFFAIERADDNKTGDRDQCKAGFRNDVVGCLHGTHKDVHIIPCGNIFQTEVCSKFLSKQLSKTDNNNQLKILTDWVKYQYTLEQNKTIMDYKFFKDFIDTQEKDLIKNLEKEISIHLGDNKFKINFRPSDLDIDYHPIYLFPIPSRLTKEANWIKSALGSSKKGDIKVREEALTKAKKILQESKSMKDIKLLAQFSRLEDLYANYMGLQKKSPSFIKFYDEQHDKNCTIEKGLADCYTEFCNSKDGEIKKLNDVSTQISKMNKQARSANNALVENVFANYYKCSPNEKEYFVKTLQKQNKDAFLTYNWLNDIFNHTENNELEINLYIVNKMILHALAVNPKNWSTFFAKWFKVVLDFLQEKLAKDGSLNHENLKKTSYPNHFLQNLFSLWHAGECYRGTDKQPDIKISHILDADKREYQEYLCLNSIINNINTIITQRNAEKIKKFFKNLPFTIKIKLELLNNVLNFLKEDEGKKFFETNCLPEIALNFINNNCIISEVLETLKFLYKINAPKLTEVFIKLAHEKYDLNGQIKKFDTYMKMCAHLSKTNVIYLRSLLDEDKFKKLIDDTFTHCKRHHTTSQLSKTLNCLHNDKDRKYCISVFVKKFIKKINGLRSLLIQYDKDDLRTMILQSCAFLKDKEMDALELIELNQLLTKNDERKLYFSTSGFNSENIVIKNLSPICHASDVKKNQALTRRFVGDLLIHHKSMIDDLWLKQHYKKNDAKITRKIIIHALCTNPKQWSDNFAEKFIETLRHLQNKRCMQIELAKKPEDRKTTKGSLYHQDFLRYLFLLYCTKDCYKDTDIKLSIDISILFKFGSEHDNVASKNILTLALKIFNDKLDDKSDDKADDKLTKQFFNKMFRDSDFRIIRNIDDFKEICEFANKENKKNPHKAARCIFKKFDNPKISQKFINFWDIKKEKKNPHKAARFIIKNLTFDEISQFIKKDDACQTLKYCYMTIKEYGTKELSREYTKEIFGNNAEKIASLDDFFDVYKKLSSKDKKTYRECFHEEKFKKLIEDHQLKPNYYNIKKVKKAKKELKKAKNKIISTLNLLENKDLLFFLSRQVITEHDLAFYKGNNYLKTPKFKDEYIGLLIMMFQQIKGEDARQQFAKTYIKDMETLGKILNKASRKNEIINSCVHLTDSNKIFVQDIINFYEICKDYHDSCKTIFLCFCDKFINENTSIEIFNTNSPYDELLKLSESNSEFSLIILNNQWNNKREQFPCFDRIKQFFNPVNIIKIIRKNKFSYEKFSSILKHMPLRHRYPLLDHILTNNEEDLSSLRKDLTNPYHLNEILRYLSLKDEQLKFLSLLESKNLLFKYDTLSQLKDNNDVFKSYLNNIKDIPGLITIFENFNKVSHEYLKKDLFVCIFDHAVLINKIKNIPDLITIFENLLTIFKSFNNKVLSDFFKEKLFGCNFDHAANIVNTAIRFKTNDQKVIDAIKIFPAEMRWKLIEKITDKNMRKLITCNQESYKMIKSLLPKKDYSKLTPLFIRLFRDLPKQKRWNFIKSMDKQNLRELILNIDRQDIGEFILSSEKAFQHYKTIKYGLPNKFHTDFDNILLDSNLKKFAIDARIALENVKYYLKPINYLLKTGLFARSQKQEDKSKENDKENTAPKKTT